MWRLNNMVKAVDWRPYLAFALLVLRRSLPRPAKIKNEESKDQPRAVESLEARFFMLLTPMHGALRSGASIVLYSF